MDLAKLKVFVQVAELGSLTKAAVALDSMQSAISRQISALEREYGGRLFHRTGRGVALTEFGQRSLPRVKALLQHAEDLEADMKGTARLPIGEVNLGVVPSLQHPLITVLFKRARERFPQVRLRLIGGASGRIAEALADGRVDIGIVFRYGRPPADEHLLGGTDTYLLGPPGDALTAGETVDFAQLDGLPMALPNVPNGFRIELDQLAKRMGIKYSIAMEVDSISIPLELAAAGEAYTVLSGQSVMGEVRHGRIQIARIVNPGIPRTISMATTTARPLTLAAREVASLTREVARELVLEGVMQPPPITRIGG